MPTPYSLWRMSIWHPDAITPDEWKYRWLKRLWLPLYDLLAIFAGIWAYGFGSPVLQKLLPEQAAQDILGLLLATLGIVCLAGVAFPALWKVEIVGKSMLVSLLTSYAAAIAIFNTSGDITSWFVVFIVLMTLPLPFFRLSLLGEEIKERKDTLP